jgi:uncharacterized membrane protein (DUF485 family)
MKENKRPLVVIAAIIMIIIVLYLVICDPYLFAWRPYGPSSPFPIIPFAILIAFILIGIAWSIAGVYYEPDEKQKKVYARKRVQVAKRVAYWSQSTPKKKKKNKISW